MKNYLFATALLFILMSTSLFAQKKGQRQNPFLQKYDTPFEVPPFNKIKSADYLPAITEAPISVMCLKESIQQDIIAIRGQQYWMQMHSVTSKRMEFSTPKLPNHPEQIFLNGVVQKIQ
jgi:hypothetical protein